MNFTIYDQATGQVRRWGSCPEEDVANQVQDGEGVVPEHFPAGQFYWDGAAMVAFPERPADHDWDWASKTWVPNVETARAEKVKAIEIERDARAAAPVIVVGGITVDADDASIVIVSRKLAEATSRMARNLPYPPDRLVWRDHFNEMHAFADDASYKAWLEDFAIALGARGTDAYAWSWEKKAQVAAATTVEEVQAITLD